MPQRVLIAMVVSLASCFAVPAMAEAQDCRAPFASRYPVAGPVNGGWDPTLERLRDATFNCEGRYSNSDYIASGGDAHHGNDFFAARGTPIVAVTDGVVAKAGFVSGLGYRVAIHDACGWEYDSGHLEAIASGIRVGLHVRAGDVLGTMGASGSGSGGSVHLHFNIHHSSDAWSDDVNPFGVVGHLANTACTPVGPSVPAWRAQVTTQSFPLAVDEFVLMPGEEVAGFIEVRNTGRETWRPGEVNLGTAEPRDAHSPIAGPDWLSPARAATLDREVPAGGVGRFVFTVRAPTTPGEYPQFFNLVREGSPGSPTAAAPSMHGSKCGSRWCPRRTETETGTRWAPTATTRSRPCTPARPRSAATESIRTAAARIWRAPTRWMAARSAETADRARRETPARARGATAARATTARAAGSRPAAAVARRADRRAGPGCCP